MGVGSKHITYDIAGDIVHGYAEDGSSDLLETTAPYYLSTRYHQTEWRTKVIFISPEEIADADYGEGGTDEKPTLDALVLKLDILSFSGATYAIHLKASSVVTPPETEDELEHAWGAGYDLFQVDVQEDGIVYIDLTSSSTSNHDKIIERGLMIAVPRGGTEYYGEYEIASIELQRHGYFHPNNQLDDEDSATSRTTIDSADFREMLLTKSLSVIGTIYASTNISLTADNFPADVFSFNQSLSYPPYSPNQTNIAMSVVLPNYRSDFSTLELLEGSEILVTVTEEGGSVLFSIHGEISNPTFRGGEVEFNIVSPLCRALSEKPYWGFEYDGDDYGYGLGNFAPYTPSDSDIFFHETTLVGIFDCFVNSAPLSKLMDFYQDDWYWLYKRFSNTFGGLYDPEMKDNCDGMAVNDVLDMLLVLIPIWNNMLAQGKLMAFHPAVYRPSLRVHTLNLEDETTGGGVLSKISGRDYGSVHFTGTDRNNTVFDTLISLDTTGKDGVLGITSANTEGKCPDSSMTMEVHRKEVCRQHSQFGGTIFQIKANLGKLGLLFYIGDQVNVYSSRWGLTGETFLVTQTSPALVGATQITLTRYADFPALHSTFEETAPIAVYYGRPILNATWDNTSTFDFDEQGSGAWRSGVQSWRGGLWASESTSHYYKEDAIPFESQYDILLLEFGADPAGPTWGVDDRCVLFGWIADTSPDVGLIVVATGNSPEEIALNVVWCTDMSDEFNESNWSSVVEVAGGGGSGVDGDPQIISLSLVWKPDGASETECDVYCGGELQGTVTTPLKVEHHDWFMEYRGYGDEDAILCGHYFFQYSRQSSAPVQAQLLRKAGLDVYYP